MKKMLSMFLALLLCVSVGGCSKNEPINNDDNQQANQQEQVDIETDGNEEETLDQYPEVKQKVEEIISFINSKCPDYPLTITNKVSLETRGDKYFLFVECKTNDELNYSIRFSSKDIDKLSFVGITFSDDSKTTDSINLALISLQIEDFGFDLKNESKEISKVMSFNESGDTSYINDKSEFAKANIVDSNYYSISLIK